MRIIVFDIFNDIFIMYRLDIYENIVTIAPSHSHIPEALQLLLIHIAHHVNHSQARC